jgi:hypothetical protein
VNALESLDWSAPWFAAVAARARAISGLDAVAAVNAAAAHAKLCNAHGRQIRFALPDAAGTTPYESHIAQTGEVPTRANRHDLLNALVWLCFPRSKARLNALQARAIEVRGVGRGRGALRDAATLVDENGVLLVTQRADLVDVLRRHDWHSLFVEHRGAWHSEIRALVFGHALMDKLAAPYKGICGHALVVVLHADASFAAIDAAAAAALDAELAPQQLLPLPVLGIPGWAANDDLAFYADAQVFRPRRDARRRAEPVRSASVA